MGRVDMAAHQGHVQLQDILPGAAAAHRPSILPEARAVEGLHTLVVVQDIRTGWEALAAVVHRAREQGRRTDWEEAACGRSTVDQAGTDADNRRRLLRWEGDRTGRTRMTHVVGSPAAAQDPGSRTDPEDGHRDLPWRQDLASAPGTTGNPRLFRGRLHQGRSSKRTNRLRRGCVRTFGQVELCGSFRS